MEVDYRALADGPTKIVANLPYNIATPLLTAWLEDPWPPYFDSLTLMFQKEVADRICAASDSKTFGRLSILSQWRCEARVGLNVGPEAFTPPPKVSSSIVHMVPKPNANEIKASTLEHLTRAAFGQRRKMLRQSLKALNVDLAALFEAVSLKGTERAEQLDVERFVLMARWLEDNR